MASVAKLPIKGKVEHATISWLETRLERAKGENFSERIIVTPGVAQALLARNPDNRGLSERKIADFARDMLSGRWMLNGEPIIVSDTGELNDGQHRLHAVIAGNCPTEMWFNFGVARSSRTTVDQGRARTAADYLHMQNVINPALSAGIAGLVMQIEDKAGTNIRTRPTHGEIVSRVHADPQIGEAAQFVDRVRKYAKGLLTPAQIGACFYLFADVHTADAADFLTKVCIGENIKRGDPAFAVRQALGNLEGEKRFERLEVTFRGFVAFRQGRKLDIAKTLGVLPALV